MKIYTKTGDQGLTSLFDGTRVPKDHQRVDTYGDVDEVNALLGVVLSLLQDEEIKEHLIQIQKDLFAIGAQLANPKHKKQKEKAQFENNRIEFLEKWIDRSEEELKPLTCFILPGGSKASSLLHFARAVCRRAERKVVALSQKEDIDPIMVVYLNRLSDCLFVVARLVNVRKKISEVKWV